MNIFKPLAIVLATARLTKLITEDEISSPVREKIAGLAFGKPVGHPFERLNYLVSCPRCTSVWAAAVCVCLAQSGKIGESVLRSLATSQAALAVLDAQRMIEDFDG